MRTILKDIAKNGRQHYKAKLKLRKKKHLISVLLLNVMLNGQEVADHLWVVDNNQLDKYKDGDVVEFDADVDIYVKGYLGRNRKAVIQKRLEVDYQLCNITNVQLVGGKSGK